MVVLGYVGIGLPSDTIKQKGPVYVRVFLQSPHVFCHCEDEVASLSDPQWSDRETKARSGGQKCEESWRSGEWCGQLSIISERSPIKQSFVATCLPAGRQAWQSGRDITRKVCGTKEIGLLPKSSQHTDDS
jgi:hypothetical protein